MNPKDPLFRRACILHFVHNFREGNQDILGQAKRRVFEVDQLFEALEQHGKPKERPESDRTRECRVEIERLSKKVDE